jgi:hypothetical protein
MSRAVKITFALVAVLGLGAGVAWGYYTAEQTSVVMESVGAMSASSATSDFAIQQFEHADADHARLAVVLEIALLEQLHGAVNEREFEWKLGLAYTRLGMIEEASGHPESARKRFEQARAWFRHGEELTDDQMKKTVKQLDGASDRLYRDIK